MGEWKSVDRWIGLAGLVAALVFGIAGILLVNEARDNLDKGVRTYGPKVVLLIACTLVISMVVAALWRTRRLRVTELERNQLVDDKAEVERKLDAVTAERDRAVSQLAALDRHAEETIRYPKYPRGRWDTLSEVRFGHLGYSPFLTYDERTGKPVGLGVELLKQLLKIPVRGKLIDVQPANIPRNWDNVLKGLVNDEYDVVATPLFATFDRSKQVGFTAPLFFSNVGLYVRKDVAQTPFWKDLSIEDLDIESKDGLRRREQAIPLRFMSVEGEISQKLAKKYAKQELIEPYLGQTILSNLFDTIANPKNPHYALFCESFFAHFQTPIRSGDVVNLMPWHKIIYPVCFATRIGDYQLRNLLNIRLLELAQDGGALNLLSKKLEESKDDGLSAEDVKRHFIAQWPYPAEIKSVAHA